MRVEAEELYNMAAKLLAGHENVAFVAAKLTLLADMIEADDRKRAEAEYAVFCAVQRQIEEAQEADRNAH